MTKTIRERLSETLRKAADAIDPPTPVAARGDLFDCATYAHLAYAIQDCMPAGIRAACYRRTRPSEPGTVRVVFE